MILEIKLKRGPDSGQTESELLNSLGSGIGFHHAGLSQHAKSVLEQGFDDGHITTIVATSTLAAGVDLPIKRVFVLDPMLGREEMAISEYKNLVGRAGRPRIDEPGEAVLFDDNRRRAKPKINRYINGDIEEFQSQIDLSQHYGILLNLARQYPSVTELMDFMGDAYFGYSGEVSESEIGSSVGEAVTDLEEWDMLEFHDRQLSLSDLGTAASKQLINPLTTHLAIRYLSNIERIDNTDFLLTIISSPEFDRGLRIFSNDQWSERDEIRADLRLTHIDRSEFGKVITTARVIEDWMNEDDLEDIYARYNVPADYWGTADVRERIVPAFVRTLTSILEILEESRAELFDAHGDEIETISKRIKHGLEGESLPWVELGIEPNRRQIVDLRERVGIRTPDELIDKPTQELAEEVGDRRAVRYRRGAVGKLLEGFARDKELILLDVREQDLNADSFGSLLSSWEIRFQNCVINHLRKVDSLRVEEVDEDKPGNHPEAYCYIYDDNDSYLTSLEDDSRFEIAIECKSKVNLDGTVSAGEATAVLGKARESTNAYVTVGTPEFSEGAPDAARENGILLLDSPSFSAAMIRMIQNEFDPEGIQAFFSQTGYLSRGDVYGYSG